MNPLEYKFYGLADFEIEDLMKEKLSRINVLTKEIQRLKDWNRDAERELSRRCK